MILVQTPPGASLELHHGLADRCGGEGGCDMFGTFSRWLRGVESWPDLPR